MLRKVIIWINFFISLAVALLFVISGTDKAIFAIVSVFWTIIGTTLLVNYYGESRRLAKWSRILLWIALAVGLVIVLLAFLTDLFVTLQFLIILPLITAIILMLSLISYIRTHNKIAVFIPIFMFVSILGIFFKGMHWPFTSILIISGWIIPVCLFFFVFYQRITEYDSRTNSFLNFFNKLIAATLIVSFLGATFKTMHWPGGSFLYIMSMPSFIISLLCLVFLLPSSNFIEWTRRLKRTFYLAILIPMLYIAIFISLGNVFPETFKKYVFGIQAVSSEGIQTYYLEKYTIPNKDGL